MVHCHRLRMREVPGADAPARRRRVVDPLGQVGLLHDQGAAGDLRRPGPRAARSRSPATRRRSPRRTGSSMDAADPARRDRRQRPCCCWSILELVRRRRLLERYALLWLFSALVLLGARDLARLLLEASRARSASPTRRTRCSSSRSASSWSCCCTSRWPSRAWPTRPRCSPSASRCSRSASVAKSSSAARLRGGGVDRADRFERAGRLG